MMGVICFLFYFLCVLFQKRKRTMLLNTKYMNIMIQIKHYQQFKQPRLCMCAFFLECIKHRYYK